MATWSLSKAADVMASLEDAWHFFSDLEGVEEWNDHLVGHEIIKGPPNEVGSEVVLHYDHGKTKSSTRVFTRVREAPTRIVQEFESDGNKYTGIAEFEYIGDGVSRVEMTMDFDMSNFSRISWPLRKAMVNVMAKDMLARYSEFLMRRAAQDLQTQMKGL